jgi:ornithine--oxo-acid transaminase
MVENSLRMGDLLVNTLKNLKSPLIKSVRGKGLFIGLELMNDSKVDGDDLAYALMKRGFLTKSTHGYTVRLAPALTINETEILACSKIVADAIGDMEQLNKTRSQGH